MGIWINNDNAILHEEESERKGRFIKIGEKVYAFFTERAIEAGYVSLLSSIINLIKTL